MKCLSSQLIKNMIKKILVKSTSNVNKKDFQKITNSYNPTQIEITKKKKPIKKGIRIWSKSFLAFLPSELEESKGHRKVELRKDLQRMNKEKSKKWNSILEWHLSRKPSTGRQMQTNPKFETPKLKGVGKLQIIDMMKKFQISQWLLAFFWWHSLVLLVVVTWMLCWSSK